MAKMNNVNMALEICRKARTILGATDQTYAMLALTGDKRFLLSPEGDAFIMYQIQGRSWIVMGDPVGPHARWADMLWQLRERADAAQGAVDLDREAARLLELQQAYQASAQIMTVAKDLFDTLLRSI